MESLLEPIWSAVQQKWLEISSQQFTYWTIIGLLGGAMFFSRFFVQWIASERKKESVIPVSFWYLSIFGSLLLLAYAIHRADVVFILMYLPNCLIYFRNLHLIHVKKKLEEAQV